MNSTRISPDTLDRNPAYAQVPAMSSDLRLIYVERQPGITRDGTVAGDDLYRQTEQAFRRVQEALKAAGAGFEAVFRLTIYLVQGQSPREAFVAARLILPPDAPEPTLHVIMVERLDHPDCLLEIEAEAAVAPPARWRASTGGAAGAAAD